MAKKKKIVIITSVILASLLIMAGLSVYFLKGDDKKPSKKEPTEKVEELTIGEYYVLPDTITDYQKMLFEDLEKKFNEDPLSEETAVSVGQNFVADYYNMTDKFIADKKRVGGATFINPNMSDDYTKEFGVSNLYLNAEKNSLAKKTAQTIESVTTLNQEETTLTINDEDYIGYIIKYELLVGAALENMPETVAVSIVNIEGTYFVVKLDEIDELE